MHWETIEEAVKYFKGQGHREIGLVNKFELHSLENLRIKSGYTEDQLIGLIEQQLIRKSLN